MDGEHHIIVAGFGRSGTTWLSDIVSKITGRLLLFEPFHPCIFESSSDFIYRDNAPLEELITHVKKSQEQLPANRWLLRNHLNHPIEAVSMDFIAYLWKNTRVGGFKTIRVNHMIGQIASHLDASVLFIHRHPLAVLSSTKNRKNFWKEYGQGFEQHQQLFYHHALASEVLTKEHAATIKKLWSSASYDQKAIIMWCVSMIITMKNLAKYEKKYMLSYEDLYISPFEEIWKILGFLSIENQNIHPAHFLTPSMTTLKTVHGKSKYGALTKQDIQDLFWKEKISQSDIETFNAIIKTCLEPVPDVYQYCLSHKYL